MEELITKENIIELIKRCSKDPEMSPKYMRNTLLSGIIFNMYREHLRTVYHKDEKDVTIGYRNNDIEFDSIHIEIPFNFDYFSIIFDSDPSILIKTCPSSTRTEYKLMGRTSGIIKRNKKVTEVVTEWTYKHYLNFGKFNFPITLQEIEDLTTLLRNDKEARERALDVKSINNRLKTYNVI